MVANLKSDISLLIVDDEQLEIDGIKSTLDFHIVGITEIHEAMNIRQAKEQFLNHQVDIMLCDIEMPQGNGLELLKWVKENYPQTQCIFVTCHADFGYAKQALQLGSLDYLLKPAKVEELERVLLKAIENIYEASEVLGHTQFSQLWSKHQRLILEHFWKEVIRGNIDSSYHEIKKAAEEINVPGLEDLMLFPILIRTQRWLKDLDHKLEKQLEFQVKTEAEMLLLKETESGVLINLDEGGLLCLFYTNGVNGLDFELIGNDCQNLIRYCQEKLDCELSCYMGFVVNSMDLVAMLDRLLALDRNNVAHTNQVLTLCESPMMSTQSNLPEMSGWTVMLENGETDRLMATLEEFRQNLVNMKELNAYMLYQIKHDFVQLIGAFLKRKGIMAHHLFRDEKSVERYNKATRSVKHLIYWMEQDLILTLQQVNALKKNKPVVEQVKEYIADNMDKDLTCEDISAHVYLNSIYLTRIFKKETGFALSEYLLAERLKLAKELLKNTSMQINTIAGNVGYSNFSHFSRMFRKHIGCSPQDYRKQSCGQRDKE